MVYAHDSKSCAARLEGSSPSSGTTIHMEHNLQSLTFDILKKGYLMSLATVDDGGPWVSDVIYIYDEDLTLYWISEVDRRHSKALIVESRVSATITTADGSSGEPEECLQIAGIAQKIEGDEHRLSVLHRQKRKKDPPPAGKGILEEGESWYCLKPTKIQLIYGALFGWEKKDVL
jgi:nitroimidazol reductase NimA-like FMN-containing flavoprotein (pyridoxamine 5'-phosphate oxidase superfamily)